MKKITTLFKKDPTDLGRVINEIDPLNSWVLTKGIATRKYDGTAVAIHNGELYKRYDVKKGKEVPVGAIPCQEPDLITGHWPHWVKCDRSNNADKWHFEAFDKVDKWLDGTYELCGKAIQKNPEKIDGHVLIRHAQNIYFHFKYDFEWIKDFLLKEDIEGIVIHELDGERMCKIRKSDFGIKR